VVNGACAMVNRRWAVFPISRSEWMRLQDHCVLESRTR